MNEQTALYKLFFPENLTTCKRPGGINNKGQVVGHSCDATDTFCIAYIWEDGVMTDLNTLVPRGSSVSLFYASDINDHGEIAGIAVDPVTGAGPAFVAIPCDEEHGYAEGCEDEAEGGSAAQGTNECPGVVPPEGPRANSAAGCRPFHNRIDESKLG